MSNEPKDLNQNSEEQVKKLPEIVRDMHGIRISIVQQDTVRGKKDGSTYEQKKGIRIAGLSNYPAKISAMQLASILALANDSEFAAAVRGMMKEELQGVKF